MIKYAAGRAELLKLLVRAGVGGTLGALHGRYISPKVLDYEDNTAARNFSTLIDALTGAVIGSHLSPTGIRELNPAKLSKAVAAYGVGQTLPVIQATLADQRNATQEAAQSAKVTSIPYNLQKWVSSPTGKGALGGAAAAGLAGLLTGSLRRKTDKEERKDVGRSSMMLHDSLKYLLPAMLAGGVVGSFHNTQDTGS